MAEIPFVELGVWLDEGVGRDDAHEVEALCSVISGCLTDAALGLAMFEATLPRHALSRKEWRRGARPVGERQRELEAEEGLDFAAPDYIERSERIRLRAEREVARARWAAGELPREYKHRLPFLHARSFISALARLARSLSRLEQAGVGDVEGLAAARADLQLALPALLGVRTSTEHIEDRARGRDRKNQKLTLPPVTNRLVDAPQGGVLILDTLTGRNFGTTLDDGTYAEVEVSDASLEAARAAAQRAFDALPWKPGHRRGVPSA